MLYRQKRAISPTGATAKCNHWSEWFNQSRPTNSTESEIPTDNDLELLCPLHSQITDIRCKDDKGEPLRPNNTYILSGDKTFKFNCGIQLDGRRGVDCYPVTKNVSCPDYAIKLFCSCSSMYTYLLIYCFNIRGVFQKGPLYFLI